VNFYPIFSRLFSDLGEIPHKRLERNAAEQFMSFMKTGAGKAVVFLGGGGGENLITFFYAPQNFTNDTLRAMYASASVRNRSQSAHH